MNKILFSAICIVSSCLLFSCVDQYDQLTADGNKCTGSFVLQDRDPNLPERLQYVDLQNASRASDQSTGLHVSNDRLLGFGYKIGNSILGDMQNVSWPVVDINKVRQLSGTYTYSMDMNESKSDYYTYTDFDRYVEKSKVSRTVTSGFSINLLLFKIGRKKKTTTSLINIDSLTSKSVFGELNVIYKTGKFSLNTLPTSLKLYWRKCLDESFKQALYYSLTGDLLDAYGNFVMTDYITGGKVNALYYGESKSGLSIQVMEKAMDDDINATFKWETDSLTGTLKFNGDNGSATLNQYQTDKTRMSLSVYGGNPELYPSLTTTALVNANYDLTAWMKSISNKDLHTLVDFADGGLCPLHNFVQEKNLRLRLELTAQGTIDALYADGSTEGVEPRIQFMRSFVRFSSSGERLYEIVPVLLTRQGDLIILSDGNSDNLSDEALKQNSDNAYYNNYSANVIYPKYKPVFSGLKFHGHSNMYVDSNVLNPLSIKLEKFDPENMYYYFDNSTNMGYIYSPTAKHAFTFYYDELNEDAVLDFYGIRDWVEELPYRSASSATLSNYTLIAL